MQLAHEACVGAMHACFKKAAQQTEHIYLVNCSFPTATPGTHESTHQKNFLGPLGRNLLTMDAELYLQCALTNSESIAVMISTDKPHFHYLYSKIMVESITNVMCVVALCMIALFYNEKV